jgi:hypothetical protein
MLDPKKLAKFLAERWHEISYIILIPTLIVLYVLHTLRKEVSDLLLIVLAVFVMVIAFRIEQFGSELSGKLEEVLKLQACSEIERLRKLRDRLDPGFEAVFGRRISHSIENLVSAVESRRIEIHDQDEFRSLYKETLSNFPKSEFLATSLATKAFFWRDPTIDDAIVRFIAGGGRMKRIFFVGTTPIEKDSEPWKIMARQESSGVEVWVVDTEELPKELYKIFLVEGDRRFAWDVAPGYHHEITRVFGTSDQKVAAKYIEQWNELVRYAKRFSDSGAR